MTSLAKHTLQVGLSSYALDRIFCIQLTIARAGETVVDPLRMDWWEADVRDSGTA
ncbi:MAG: hypothetical protein ACOCWY_01010 [Thermodesulfobacteriota bacterium]